MDNKLPNLSELIDSEVTEGDFKVGISKLWLFLTELLGSDGENLGETLSDLTEAMPHKVSDLENDAGYLTASTMPNRQHGVSIFTSSGIFTVPTGVTSVYVRLMGCGGGCQNYDGSTRRSGGATSFGSYVTVLAGCDSGYWKTYHYNGAAGAEPSGADVSLKGRAGSIEARDNPRVFSNYGYGGYSTGNNSAGGYGAEGNYAEKSISGLTPGEEITVTVGTKGSVTGGSAKSNGGAVVIVYW